MKKYFVWLGSGRSKKWDVGVKAQLLDQAAKAGLPVPPGAILLDEFFQLVMDEGVITIEKNDAGQTHCVTPDPQWLSETLFDSIRLPRMEKAVAVRTASEQQGATPQLAVDLNDATALSESLCAIWSQADMRRDVLVMEEVEGGEKGTAVSHHASKTDRIASQKLSQLTAWQRPYHDLPPHIQRLQKLLRGVRRTFGAGDWAVDWIDDGRICWLLQISRQ